MNNLTEPCIWSRISWSAWRQQLGMVSLGNNELHIWQVCLQLPPPEAAQCLAWLSPEEKQCAYEFRFNDDSARYIAAHGLLRYILAGYIGKQPAELRFVANRYGKPDLNDETNQAVRFNLSHSGDRALIAVMHRQEVGVDIEKADCNLEYEDIAHVAFSPQELGGITSARPDLRLSRFYTIWTGKEAYLKMLGIGLNEEADRQQSGEYALWNFTPEENYYGAVAVNGKVAACRYYRLICGKESS